MPEASEDEIGPLAEASNAAIDPDAEIADTGGQRMTQVRLDMAMALLLGVQVGSIGWQPVHLDLGMCLHRRCDHSRAMGVEPVPDDDAGARHVLLEVTEGRDHVLSTHGRRTMALVEAARQGHPDDCGQCTALADASQDRCLPPRSPCGPRFGPEGEAGLIDEHDFRLSTASLLFIRGQSCMSQARTSASSRSRA